MTNRARHHEEGGGTVLNRRFALHFKIVYIRREMKLATNLGNVRSGAAQTEVEGTHAHRHNISPHDRLDELP
jgi:hypothetical protein